MRLYKAGVAEGTITMPMEQTGRPWWLRKVMVLGAGASQDKQRKYCPDCEESKHYSLFHIARWVGRGMYLRRVCKRCDEGAAVRQAKAAMRSIYEAEGRTSGPMRRITREQAVDGLRELGSVRAVAERYGVTVQAVYRVKRFRVEEAGAWWIKQPEKEMAG